MLVAVDGVLVHPPLVGWCWWVVVVVHASLWVVIILVVWWGSGELCASSWWSCDVLIVVDRVGVHSSL